MQGQRPLLDAAGSIPWTELLFHRITLGFDQIPTGAVTAASEAGLEIGTNTYFYIERPHPHFGESVVAFDELGGASTLPVASPFDTGGLWTRHIPTDIKLDDDGRRSVVARWSLSCRDYQAVFDQWVIAAMGAPSNYRSGARPSSLLVDEIDLENCGDQAWTWEGRIPKASGGENTVLPVRVYLMDGRLSIYLSWLRDTRWLSDKERRDHMSWLAAHVVETANPVDEMIRYLEGH